MLSEQVIHDVVNGAQKTLGDNLNAVVLFGSVARGDAQPESDVDVALLVNRELTREKRSEMLSFRTFGCAPTFFLRPSTSKQANLKPGVMFCPFIRISAGKGLSYGTQREGAGEVADGKSGKNTVGCP